MKRILSLLLIAVFVFSLPVGVFANETTQQEFTDAAFARAFGLIDEDTEITAPLTRYALAELYCKAMFGETDFSAETPSHPFADVSDAQANVVAQVYQLGIMNGTEMDAFSPDETATLAQLLKSMICFFGYSDIAEEKGGFTFGYVTQANTLGLIEYNLADLESRITYELAVSVFKLALNAHLRYPLADTYQKGNDYLETYRGIKRDMVFVEADNITDLSGAERVDAYDRVMLDSSVYKLTDDTLSLKNYVGYYANIYYKNTAIPEVVYYELAPYRTISFSGEDVIGAVKTSQGYRIDYYNEADRQKSLSVLKSTRVVYNGSVCETYDEAILNPFSKNLMDGSVEAVDSDADGNYDVLFVNAYQNYVVLKVDGDKIYNKFNPSVILNFAGFEEGDMQILNIFAEPIPFADICEGDVLNVFEDINGNIKRIVVTVDTLSGTIESFSAKKSVTINQNALKYTETLKKQSDFADFQLGETVKVFFNLDGKICNFEKVEDLGLNFGYLVNAAEEEGAFKSTYRMRIYNSGGFFGEYTLAEKVVLNGSDSKVDAAVAFAPALEGGVAKRQLIRYRADRTTMEISEIMYCSSITNVDGLYMYDGFDGVTPRKSYPYKTAGYTFGGKLLVSTSTIVFTVPKGTLAEDEDIYSVKAVSKVFSNDNTSTLFEAYGTVPDNPVADVLVVKKSVSESMHLDDNIILVNSVVKTLSEDGKKLDMVTGVCNGQEREILFEANALEGVSEGDIIYPIRQRGDGVWKSAKLIFDYSERSLTTANPSAEFTADIRFCSGKVIAKGDDFFSISIVDTTGEESLEHYSTERFKYALYDANGGKNQKVSVATADDILDAKNYTSGACFVVVHTRRGDSKSVVIYKD